jgi:arsenate reductase
MKREPMNVLFLCTGNSARSIFAESILNQLGSGRFRAYSAGSHPRGEVHPLTRQVLEKAHYPSAGLRSKSWDEFGRMDAPHMHFVITVCDQAAGEVCPMWPGQPMTAHWGFEDPVQVVGSDEVQLKAFQKAMFQIANRISILLSLPMEKLDRLALQEKVREIGRMASVEPAPAVSSGA